MQRGAVFNAGLVGLSVRVESDSQSEEKEARFQCWCIPRSVFFFFGVSERVALPACLLRLLVLAL